MSTVIKLYLCSTSFGTNKLWQDELSKEVISEGRNSRSDKMSRFC